MNAFCNQAVAICCENVFLFMGKKILCISQGMKKTQLVIIFVIIFESYALLCVFLFDVLRAKLSDLASAHNSGSPVLLVYLQVKDMLYT